MQLLEQCWAMVARRLAASPRAVALIRRAAARTPYFDIHDKDGTLYMRRWWLLPRWCLDFDPERGYPMPKAWMPFSIRLHHIVRPDADRDLHDHPFNFRSLVLEGMYYELGTSGWHRRVEAGTTYRAPATRWHRIDGVSDGGAWTLFVMGRRINDWGFLVNGRKVPWREYLGVETMS